MILDKLLPRTKYYFRIKITDEKGTVTTSDIYTFTTAAQRQEFTITRDTTTLSWDQLLLTSSEVKSVLIPRGTPLTIHIRLSNSSVIQDVRARIVNNNVLGITETRSTAPVEETRLIEILPGIFAGDVQPSPVPGNYTITISLS